MSNDTENLKVRKKYEDFLEWLFEHINNFPRKQKFLLGRGKPCSYKLAAIKAAAMM